MFLLKQFGLLLQLSVFKSKNQILPNFLFFLSIILIVLLSSCQTVKIEKLTDEYDEEKNKVQFLKSQKTVTFLDDASIIELYENADFYNFQENEYINKNKNESKSEDAFSVFSFAIKSPSQKIDAECSIVKINLSNPSLCIEITDSLEKLQLTSINPWTAINSVPFAVQNKKVRPVGIVKIGTQFYSEMVQKYGALLFTKQESGLYSVKIIENQKSSSGVDDYENAIGGFFQNLKDGELIDFKKFRNSRISLGLADASDGSHYVYLFTAISNSVTDKSALTYEECGKILKTFGCQNAIQFDGGRSSVLYVNGIKKSSFTGWHRKKEVPYYLVFFSRE